MNTQPSSMRGFTLVELMVVIVIMGIMASLVMMNIGGTDQRKAMQAREVFLMDVQKILRESNDQSRILALNVQAATDVADFQYDVMEYLPKQNTESLLNQNNNWQNYKDFSMRVLPEHVTFSIQSLERRYENANNSELLNQNAPKLIWLGNGEVKPVRIQFYFEERPVGNEIEIDHLGKINES
ncbi:MULTISPECIES: type II secretion system protein [Acinetobacter]|jgi:general secretion pathway protein G|uniref:Type II secretion system protein n=2 Tax=Acinetobacter TaxID=469 RepID=A0A4Q7AW15_9GAMM|nr:MULTISPECIES: type II secretion system protein [Acinetobacter]MCW8039243.1 type II secretion system GspH family protein [Acinetobacter entericus]RZG66565.1 type II secretion system protein [Acinetobacter bouvetii]TCB71516.1 type II secretion system protein [Acinetobacter sp. ANC 4177]